MTTSTNPHTTLSTTSTTRSTLPLAVAVPTWSERLRAFLLQVLKVAKVIMPAGWTVLALLALALIGTFFLGWREAAVLAMVPGIVFATCLVWLIPQGGHQVEHELLEPRMQVGDRAVIHVTVKNPTHRLLMPTRMEMRVGKGQAVFVVPALVPEATNQRGFILPTKRRGVVDVGPVLTADQDPLGLMRHERLRTRPQSVHIYPRTVHLGIQLNGTMRDVEGAVTQELSSSDVSFHALRDYIPGDDRRNVHWRSTARTGRLMVRQFEETRRASLVVLLSTRSEDYATEDDFETAVSSACSLALDALASNREVHVLTQNGPLPTATPQRLLDASCLVEATSEIGLDDLAGQAIRAFPALSVLAIVTGQATEAAVLGKAHRTMPLAITSFAVQCGAKSLSRSHIGQLPVVDVHELQELPRAIRAMVPA
ncbi:Uncharacterized conserved protein (some members contain a von Willebrand factor type A (vWA) domain) [Actinomyces bovis]|uniref:Uncharacterized conserved protein (Some members contain a von Willebrand factor type A (VWA) domain) n=1 Tax=Actinomyces bovis TaxID=1658 RepID=A0ABY1VLY4_9ACTO|nr:DUF58 domain-containing protein [Actinomyces bovis]SPT53119.1 Uncharacterized conserved protein (some members contain a von Willebrand factor type A (vWA) domain) [Actinomyces bovis]VEG52258.1 Uncharacterized conserved protein (some members contain a von Willebrand factor type A (vWA) domain) [Actinomyces israelii]